MQRRLGHYAWILVILALLTLAWPRAARFLAVDKCLDNGGRWDEAGDSCVSGRPSE